MKLLHAATQRTITITTTGEPQAKPKFVMTPFLAGKVLAACVFAVLTIYFLSSGKNNKDIGKLFWAGIFGLLTAVVFGL